MKTNEQAKQEAIKKAYGENWDKVKEFCDHDGWVKDDWIAHGVADGISYENAGYNSKEIDFKSYNGSDNTWRLKSLWNLKANNGWIRIEPNGSNLPSNMTPNIDFKVLIDGKESKLSRDTILVCYRAWNLTHYKPIKEELKPILLMKRLTILLLLAITLTSCATSKFNNCPTVQKRFKPIGGARTWL